MKDGEDRENERERRREKRDFEECDFIL